MRGLELSDLDAIMSYWNDYEMRRNLFRPWPFSSEDEQAFIRSSWEKQRKMEGFNFAIERLSTSKLVGTCGVDSIDWISRSAGVGIALDRTQTDQGLGTEAMQLLLWFAFDLLNLERLELEVWDFNKRAIHVYEKLGFRHAGRRRMKGFREGRHFDSLLMDILRSERLEYMPVEAQDLD